ncbi:hypothetical protein OO012_16470 [Rhodobacteraceae bacterium KMM 6894]|nr:hypothetical protein [Rhodobacteraceae bacterium KMM 6894]
MSFVRPEAHAALTRWRSVLIWGAVCAFGLWWALFSYGTLVWLGGVLALAGGAMAIAAIQRMRFGQDTNAPGVVRVDEGAIAYFGPLTGGVVARSEMTVLALDRTGRPAHWVLSQPGQPDVMIPLGAEGADALFDAFAALPGMRTERMLAEMRRDTPGHVVIWHREGHAPAHLRLT